MAAADVDGTSARRHRRRRARQIRGPVQLSMRSVEVEGVGAFTADAVTYPAPRPRACAPSWAITGTTACSDSNGAGKTTLVMAATTTRAWDGQLGYSRGRRAPGSADEARRGPRLRQNRAGAPDAPRTAFRSGEREGRRSKLLGLSPTASATTSARSRTPSLTQRAAMDADLGARVASARTRFTGSTTVGQLRRQRRRAQSRAGRARGRGHVARPRT